MAHSTYVIFERGRPGVPPIGRALRDWVTKMRSKNWHSITAIAGVFLAFLSITAPCAKAGPSDLDLVCTGNSYGKGGDPFPATENVSFKTGTKNRLMIDLPGSNQPIKASIISHNPIQLRFSAHGLIGEYFNFTGDLFLIHNDGRFTKLSCKPKT